MPLHTHTHTHTLTVDSLRVLSRTHTHTPNHPSPCLCVRAQVHGVLATRLHARLLHTYTSAATHPHLTFPTSTNGHASQRKSLGHMALCLCRARHYSPWFRGLCCKGHRPSSSWQQPCVLVASPYMALIHTYIHTTYILPTCKLQDGAPLPEG